jgi:serine/threonine-protein kinase
MDVFAFASMSALVSAMCLEFRGIASPLALGIMTIMVYRTAIVPDRWQRGVVPIGLTALAYPVTLLALAFFSTPVAAQLRDGQALGVFVLNQLFIFGAAAIGVMGNHKMWALRRQVYEARMLGRYKLKQQIGKGGMGEVWLAHHNTLARDVAIKILRPDKIDDEAIVRFEREVRATSDLSHPNTVRVFDYGVTEDGFCYYAMEFLKGRDLSSLVKSEGPLDAERVLSIATQTAKALVEAHSRGIIHRDLKPGNLILTTAGHEVDFVKVVDFGLALVQSAEMESAVTNTGFIVGTPAYIAPELLKGIPADSRADIYALGAVMYELLCGSPPFAHEDARRMLMARTQSEPPPPSTILKQAIPPPLESIIMTCLHREPDDRYNSSNALLHALEACDLKDDGRGPMPDLTDEVLTGRFDRRGPRRAGQSAPPPQRAQPPHTLDSAKLTVLHPEEEPPSTSRPFVASPAETWAEVAEKTVNLDDLVENSPIDAIMDPLAEGERTEVVVTSEGEERRDDTAPDTIIDTSRSRR